MNYFGGDNSFYAQAGEWLNLCGQENVTLDPLRFANITKEPYHYGDIWGIALLQKITGLHPLMVTNFILYPACISIFVFGILSWINARLNIKKKSPGLFNTAWRFCFGYKFIISPLYYSGRFLCSSHCLLSKTGICRYPGYSNIQCCLYERVETNHFAILFRLSFIY
jgi:hypothetical protein